MTLNELGDIAMSWYRSMNPTQAQHNRAMLRLSICNTCEFKERAVLFDGYKCAACGCPLHKKIFTEHATGCPKGKWSE